MKTILLPVIAVLFFLESEAKTIPQRLTVPANYPPVSFTGDEKQLPAVSSTATCNRLSPDFAYYNDIANYIPDANTPVKVIEVAFNIFQKDDGSGNFRDQASDKEALLTLLGWINNNYANGDLPSDPIIPQANEILNRKIQFSLGPLGKERIYFYKNSNLQKADCFNTTGYSVGNLQAAAFQADPARKNYLNVYFTEGNAGNGSSGCAALPGYGETGDLYQVIYGAWSRFEQSGYSVNDLWVFNVIMRHELAHNIDIGHTYDCAGGRAPCDKIDYWDDIFGPYQAGLDHCPPAKPTCGHCQGSPCWGTDASAVPGDGVTNNIVGGNQSQAYASPKQLGQMHRALSLMTVRKYVSPCIYTPLQPIIIGKNQLWDFDIRLYSDLVIQPGATLDLTCKITMPCNSKIIVKPGATLKMQKGSEIIAYDNARILIEAGGTLWHDNGIITLNGTNTVLEIKGKLDLQANSLFSFQPNGYAQGNGYIKLSSPAVPPSTYLTNNIVAGAGAQIVLAGTGPSDKVLEVTQESMYAGSLASEPMALFSITKGRVELANDSRLNVGCKLTLRAVRVTSNTGSFNSHRGLAIYGQAGVSINNATFEYGTNGVSALLTYGGSPLTIDASIFRSCTTGLTSTDKGVTLRSCHFSKNNTGWTAKAMTFPCVVSDSNFTDQTISGISFTGSTTLTVTSSNISANGRRGIEFGGSGTLAIKCGSVSNNGTLPKDAGILLSDGANLNMSPKASPPGGNVTAVNNRNTIYSNGGNTINLLDGYNDLRPFASTGARVLIGNVKNNCSTTLIATTNKWRTTLAAPVNNVDYSLKTTLACGFQSITVKDTSPKAVPCPGSGPRDADARVLEDAKKAADE